MIDASISMQEMKCLQNSLPVVFDLIGGCSSYITREMLKKAQAPFSDHVAQSTSLVTKTENEVKSLCFFPTLPVLHLRRRYESDCSKKTSVCTKKKHTGHPSLTPGIFTIFCHHGT